MRKFKPEEISRVLDLLKLGLTQTEVARALGKTQQWVSKVVKSDTSDKSQPSLVDRVAELNQELEETKQALRNANNSERRARAETNQLRRRLAAAHKMINELRLNCGVNEYSAVELMDVLDKME